jgi:hypothetical protein
MGRRVRLVRGSGRVSVSGPLGKKRISDFDNRFPNKNRSRKKFWEKWLGVSEKYEILPEDRVTHLEQLSC